MKKKLYTLYLELLRTHTYIYVKSTCSEIKRNGHRNEKQNSRTTLEKRTSVSVSLKC